MPRQGTLTILAAALFVLAAPVPLALAQQSGSATGVMICSKCGRSYTGGGACPICYPPSSSPSGTGGTSGYDPNAFATQGARMLGSALGDALHKWLFEDSENRERDEALAQQRAAMAEAARRQEEQRRREEEERRRVEEARRQRELMEQMRLARVRDAARMRQDLDRRDAEMTERLDGLFTVGRATRSTPNFGIPGNPDPEGLRDAPNDPSPKQIYGGGSSLDTLSALEDQLRRGVGTRTWTQVSPETAVVIGSPGDSSVVDLRNSGSLIPPVRIGAPVESAASQPPASLINPLREPERWDAYVRRERMEKPELYANLDRYNEAHPWTQPLDRDMVFLFSETDPSRRTAPAPVNPVLQELFPPEYQRWYEDQLMRSLIEKTGELPTNVPLRRP